MNESPRAESRRCFIAIALPPDLMEAVRRVQQELRAAITGPGVRWTQPDQWHLTLRFLGAVPGQRLPELRDACRRASVGMTPFDLSLEGLGSFPPNRAPRVLWVGVQGDLGLLQDLHQRVEATTTGLGSHTETKGFDPHLTLGRVKTPGPIARIWSDVIHARRDIHLGEWRIREFNLMQSHLTPRGARYEILATAPLPLTGKR